MTETKVVKITKKMRFEEIKGILENLERADLVEFIEKEIELLVRKSASRSTKPTKRQKENVEVKELVYSALEKCNDERGMTCTEISVALDNEFTPQRIRPQLKALIDEDKVINYLEKGVSLFKLKED